MDDFGFIIVRHINSEKTNKYWNTNVKLLRTLYPRKQIVVIDDNSKPEFIKPDFDYKNIIYIKSEFPGRGELLPYYYYLKFKFFNNAVIIHDSVFFHKRINFENLKGINVLPLWYFNSDAENYHNTHRISRILKNSHILEDKLSKGFSAMGMSTDKWNGCFGVQSYINLKFLERIEQKYRITNLVNVVKCRSDRCCLERIFGAIFCTENPSLVNVKSLFGDIMSYQKWGYTYDDYIRGIANNRLPKPVIKVWTGR